jgi:ComF family protein
VTAFAYRFPVDRLVQRFKFSGDLALGNLLGEALFHAASASARPDLVLASPSSSRRLRERGFNPALVLARHVASRLALPIDPHALVKSRHTPPQAGLDRAGRQRNVRGAYQCVRGLEGLHVAVVDDVMTTGSTMAAIAAELVASGAKRVSGWVVARTPEPFDHRR